MPNCVDIVRLRTEPVRVNCSIGYYRSYSTERHKASCDSRARLLVHTPLRTLPFNLYGHLSSLRIFPKILTQTVRVRKLLDGAKQGRNHGFKVGGSERRRESRRGRREPRCRRQRGGGAWGGGVPLPTKFLFSASSMIQSCHTVLLTSRSRGGAPIGAGGSWPPTFRGKGGRGT